jgi:alpha-beta hydrolase superfamily lysophospholipase
MQRFLKHDEPALIWTGDIVLDGRLTVPAAAPGIILIPGLGGTFHHDGIRSLAAHFHDNGFGTLIADLLTPDEQQFDARTRHFRADVPLLASRLAAIADWLAKEDATHELPVALFASGLVGSAALLALARGTADFFALALTLPRLGVLRSVVSGIKTPALLIIDETSAKPTGVLEGELRIERIASVTPLLESSAALTDVAQKALVWFRNHVQVTAMAE